MNLKQQIAWAHERLDREKTPRFDDNGEPLSLHLRISVALEEAREHSDRAIFQQEEARLSGEAEFLWVHAGDLRPTPPATQLVPWIQVVRTIDFTTAEAQRDDALRRLERAEAALKTADELAAYVEMLTSGHSGWPALLMADGPLQKKRERFAALRSDQDDSKGEKRG